MTAERERVEAARRHIDAARTNLGRAARLAGHEAGAGALNAMEECGEELDALGAFVASLEHAAPPVSVSAEPGGARSVEELAASLAFEKLDADEQAYYVELAEAGFKAPSTGPASGVEADGDGLAREEDLPLGHARTLEIQYDRERILVALASGPVPYSTLLEGSGCSTKQLAGIALSGLLCDGGPCVTHDGVAGDPLVSLRALRLAASAAPVDGEHAAWVERLRGLGEQWTAEAAGLRPSSMSTEFGSELDAAVADEADRCARELAAVLADMPAAPGRSSGGIVQTTAGEVDDGLFRLLAKVTRKADEEHQTVGGGTRHWLRECFLPELESAGLAIVRRASTDKAEGADDDLTSEPDEYPTLAEIEAANAAPADEEGGASDGR